MTVVSQPPPVDPSRGDLLLRLALLRARVAKSVAERRAGDERPDDPFRGLYLSDDDVDRLLEGRETVDLELAGAAAVGAFDAAARGIDSAADDAEAEGKVVRLRRLARNLGLDPTDLELLLVALAPHLDPRFERFYGYLNDDVSRSKTPWDWRLNCADSTRPMEMRERDCRVTGH